MHLAESIYAFIQSDLQCIQAIHFFCSRLPDLRCTAGIFTDDNSGLLDLWNSSLNLTLFRRTPQGSWPAVL